jgi:hypothetical protein
MDGKFRKFTMSVILQVFWDDSASVVKNAVFPGGYSRSAQTYNNLSVVQEFITLRPFVISESVNDRWKDEKLL